MPTPADAAGSFPAAAIPAAAPRRRPASAAEDIVYPSSDGKRMAENTWQGKAIIATAGDLQVALPADALVAADVLVYPKRGSRKSRAPDVLVALGVGTHHRMSYFVWEEGKPPDWVLEVASPSTKEKDLGDKLDDYLAMGVPEYWLFDPKGGQFPSGMPRLRGLELKNGKYRPLGSRLEDGVRMIHSEVLGSAFAPRGICCASGIRRHAGTSAIITRKPRSASAPKPGRTGKRPLALPPRLASPSWRPRCGVRGPTIRREGSAGLPPAWAS